MGVGVVTVLVTGVGVATALVTGFGVATVLIMGVGIAAVLVGITCPHTHKCLTLSNIKIWNTFKKTSSWSMLV